MLFIWISLVISVVKYLLLHINSLDSSSKNCLLPSFSYYLLLPLLSLNFISPLYVLDISSVSIIWPSNIFLPLHGLCFKLVDGVLFCTEQFRSWVIYIFNVCAFGEICKKLLLNPPLWSLSPKLCFSFVLQVSLIHLDIYSILSELLLAWSQSTIILFCYLLERL